MRAWRTISRPFCPGALLLAAALVGAGCSSAGDDPGPAVPVQPAGIYAQMCARCHGPGGHGDPEIKKTLPNVRDFADPVFQAQSSYEEIGRVIMTGKGQMPAFGAALSMPKIQALSGYVKRLGKPSAPH
ncbi:MAG TPA: cytochrome c [Polyangia bacterium]|jgi:mono/diheme cytochrome c family protein|nr:cytochrome c [Polyangia bacterium]